MDSLAIDRLLEQIRGQLNLTKQTEHEVLAEIRTHLEDVVAEAECHGRDPALALRRAAEEFGLEEVGAELQEVHRDYESIDALLLCILPVVFALALRWLAFSPDGTALHWHMLLARPGFWVVAGAALLVPFLYFTRWRLALIGWLFFWLLSVIFIVFPKVSTW